MIPKETIELILDQTDLVDVVSRYVDLKQKGSEHQSQCPFLDHPGDKDPSFKVTPRTQLFYCFGCKKGGTAINFLMEYRRCSFIEAVKELADIAGIKIVYENSDNDLMDRIRNLYDKVQSVAVQAIQDMPDEDNYFLTVRGLSPQIITEFWLGYCNGSWYDQFKSVYDYKVLFESGLFVYEKDKLSGRFVIPFIDPQMKLTGFSGTNVGADPKYNNTKDNESFSKKQFLYGLPQASSSIQKADTAILVEGFFDCLALHQGGIKNTVATCGTAMTPGAAKLLARYTKCAILMFDGDKAGREAVDTAYASLSQVGIKVLVVDLPDGEDPDDIIIKQGDMKKMVNVLRTAVEYVDKKFPKKAYDAGDKQALIAEAKRVADIFDDKDAQYNFIERVSENIDVDVPRIYNQDQKKYKAVGEGLPEIMKSHINEMILLAALIKSPHRQDIGEELFADEIKPFYRQVCVAAGVEASLYNNLSSGDASVMSQLVFMVKDGVDIDLVARAVRKEQLYKRIDKILRHMAHLEVHETPVPQELRDELNDLITQKGKIR